MIKQTTINALKFLGMDTASTRLGEEETKPWVTTSGTDFDHVIQFIDHGFDWDASIYGRQYWHDVLHTLFALKRLNPTRQFMLECI